MNFAEFITTLYNSDAPMGLPLLVILGLAGLSFFMLVIFGCVRCTVDGCKNEVNIAEATQDDPPPAQANEDSRRNQDDQMPAESENSKMAACMANDDQDPSCSKLSKTAQKTLGERQEPAQPDLSAVIVDQVARCIFPNGAQSAKMVGGRQTEYVAITIEPAASGSFPIAVAAEDPQSPNIPEAQQEGTQNIEMKQVASDIALDVAKLEPDDPLTPHADQKQKREADGTEAETTDLALYAPRLSFLHPQMIRPSLPPPPPPKSGHLHTPPTPPAFTSIQMEQESEFSTMPSEAAWRNREVSTSLGGMLNAAQPEVSEASLNPPPPPPLPFEQVPHNRTRLERVGEHTPDQIRTSSFMRHLPESVDLKAAQQEVSEVSLNSPPPPPLPLKQVPDSRTRPERVGEPTTSRNQTPSFICLLPEIVDLDAAQQEGNVKTDNRASSRFPFPPQLPAAETECVPDYRTPEAGRRGARGLSTSADFSRPTSYKRDVPVQRRSVGSGIAERVRIFEKPHDDETEDEVFLSGL